MSKAQISTDRDVEALVVGAGMSGIGAGVTLLKSGYDDFLIIDKGSEFGGTWAINIYPGVACDIPSQVYSFGFAPHREWSRIFAPGKEIHQYLLDIVDRYKLRAHACFGSEMLDARWDEGTSRWIVEASTGTYRARILILATGFLEEPRIPDIPGLDSFPGQIFHTSRWPRDYDPRGERVAVIGTGASGVQLVPEIASEVRSLALFQRTPAWVLPKPDWTHSTLTLRLLRRLKVMQPLLRSVEWAGAEAFLASLYSVKVSNLISLLGMWNLHRSIKDPAIRKALTPDHVLGCKRVMLSNTYYRALVRDNVEFVPSALAEIRGSTLIGANGTKCEADTIIFATGFHVIDHPVHERIHGKDGRSLAEGWNGRPRAYKGVTAAGFPNAFILWGPNGGGPSLFTAVEATLRYVGAALRIMRAQDIDTVEVRAEAEQDWKDMANRYTARSVQNIGGCQSFYLDRNGDNLTLFPDTMRGMMRSLSSFDSDAYHVTTTSKAAATST